MRKFQHLQSSAAPTLLISCFLLVLLFLCPLITPLVVNFKLFHSIIEDLLSGLCFVCDDQKVFYIATTYFAHIPPLKPFYLYAVLAL